MSTCRRPPIGSIAPCALLAAGLVLVGGATAAPAPPGFPPIGSIPGSETARFKVVVEGTATAAKDEDWSALTPCVVSIHTRIEETTTYRRGKGVLMEFVRLGKGPGAPVIVQRAGRRFDATLALKVTTTRTGEGTASRQNPPEGGVCDPRSEDLSQGPDCGKPVKETVNVGMLYRGALLSLGLKGLGTEPVIDCPLTEIRPGIPTLHFGWPAPPKLPQFIILRDEIFGKKGVRKKKVIVRTVDTGDPLKRGPMSGTTAGLTYTVSDFGTNKATIRLIRVP